MEIILTFINTFRKQLLTSAVVATCLALVFLIPQSRQWAVVHAKEALGIGATPVTIVNNSDEALAPLQERVTNLEQTIASLEKEREGDKALLASLNTQYAAAQKEVLAAHDSFAKEAAQVQTVLKGSAPATEEKSSGKVSINTGSLSDLDSLPGIGPTYAQRIIDYRTQHGKFKTVDDLGNVSGIGPATITKIRDLVEL